MKKHQMLIGGKWVDPACGEWFESVNPFTAKPWALVPRGSKDDVDRAIGAAKCAFQGEWRDVRRWWFIAREPFVYLPYVVVVVAGVIAVIALAFSPSSPGAHA